LDADAFWEEMRKQDKDGRYALYNKMEEFNIPSMKELARLLGYKSPGSLYAYLKGERVTNVDFKKRVFMFFSDELNVQIPKTNEKTYVKTKNTNDDPEMDAYYRNTDFVKLLRNTNKTQKELAEIVGVTSGVISRMVNRKNKPGDRTLRKIKEYFENTGVNRKVVEEVEPVSEKILEEISSSFPEIPTSAKAENSNTIATRYRNELTSIDEEINKLNIRKSVCLEVLKVIEELEQGK
jgi:transcriptional regulator with XRE-family HTH domain